MAVFNPFKMIDIQFANVQDPRAPAGTLRTVPAPSNTGTNFTDLQTLTVPIANDRTSVLNAAVANQFSVLGSANERIGALNYAMQELQKISPTGVNDDKQAKTEVPGYSFASGTKLSEQTWNTLLTVKDASGTAITSLFTTSTNSDGSVNILKMVGDSTNGKTFAQATTIMKSVVDQASQNNQLEMTSLQGLTNKYNQSIETMSDLVSKFADLGSKLVSNFRPLR